MVHGVDWSGSVTIDAAVTRATRPATGNQRTTTRTTRRNTSALSPTDFARRPGVWSRPARSDCTIDSVTPHASSVGSYSCGRLHCITLKTFIVA